MNRSNTWGWIGMILVVGLIGAGFLYQREGGQLFPPDAKEKPPSTDDNQQLVDRDSQPVADPMPPTQPRDTASQSGDAVPTPQSSAPAPPNRTSRKLPGRVEVIMKFTTSRVAWAKWGRFPADGPWLYVNGQLTKNPSDRRIEYAQGPQLNAERTWIEVRETLSLEPGNYLIEFVVEGYDPKQIDVFVLQTQSRRIQVEADKSVEFAAEFPIQLIVAKREAQVEFQGVPDNLDTWLRDYTDRANQQVKLFDIDPLVTALTEAKKSLGGSPPPKPVAMVDLPEKYGGRRELTAIQVRLIVDWLQRKYWGDWTDADTLRVNASVRANAEANKQQINLLDAIIKRHREDIEQLNSLARKLDQAKTQ